MPTNFLTDAFTELSTSIGRLITHKYKTEDAFTEQYQKIKETHAQLPDWSIQKKDGLPSFFYYISPSTGEDIIVKSEPMKLEDQLARNTLQQLRAYQWLLAESFEEFEQFVVKAYGYCGFAGIDIWNQPEDWRPGKTKEIGHYLGKFKSKDRSGVPFIQLNAFRANSEYFARHETNGLSGTNYKVMFALIEQFRHRIVHNGGYCKNLRVFLDGMQKRLPGISRETYTPFVESYFFLHGDRHLIDLLEYEAFNDDGTPNGGFHDTLPHFLKLLVEYAQLVVDSIRVHPRATGV